MPYSTIPITSGAAKFSTLDPDAALFLAENDITVGANPENPATLYDYNTSTLTIGNIQTSNGELNIHNSDLLGVKRFVCEDYLGAVKAIASDNLKWTLNIGGLNYTAGSTKNFRVPSNFVTSTIKITFGAYNNGSADITVSLEKLDPDTQTYSAVSTQTIAAHTSSTTVTISSLTVNAGEIYKISKTAGTSSGTNTHQTKILCDLVPYSGGYWEISE